MEYENLVALTTHLSNHQNSYEFLCCGYKENKCVVATESDGEANTRTESIDYDGFLCGAWWGVIQKECNLNSSCCKVTIQTRSSLPSADQKI